MAEIINFPDRSHRARLEAIVRWAYETHDPATRSKKISDAMAVLDKYGHMPSFQLQAPSGQPFTDDQVQAIKVAVHSHARLVVEMMRSAMLDIITLRTILTDLENG